MKHWGWVAMVLAGCSYDATYVETAGTDALRADASAVWASVGVSAPADYTVVQLDAGELMQACRASDPNVGACSFPGVVLLRSGLDYAQALQNLIHELGHLMRGGGAGGELDHTHLPCPESAQGRPGPDVMCLTGAAPGTMPTARDVAFVRS